MIAETVTAGEAGLGKDTDFPTRLRAPMLYGTGFLPMSIHDYAQPEEGPQGRKYTAAALGWLSRVHGRKLLRASAVRHRLALCGARIQHKKTCIKLYRAPDAARGKVKGVCVCGQTICCPVCAPRVGAFRSGEIEQAFKVASERGLDMFLAACTAPHEAGSSLMDEALWWRRAWLWAFSEGRQAKDVKADWVGYILNAEMTWGQANGWHFHRHPFVFVRPGYGELAAQMMRDRWHAALRRFGRWTVGASDHAFRSEPVTTEGAARYCSKIGAELASQSTKASQTPLSILRDAALRNAPAPLWIEALQVCSKLKIGSVRWSRGLRGEMGVGVEKSDEELAEDTVEASDELLGCLTAGQWRQIVAHRLEFRLMQIAQEGAEAVETFLRLNGCGGLMDPETALMISGDSD